MNDSFYEFLSGLLITENFSIEGIRRNISSNTQAKIFGNLTREQYAEKAFFVPDLAALPVGHLADHRLRMPPRLQEHFSRESYHRIEMLLWRMLCVPEHPEGREMIARALRLDVASVAAALIAMRQANPVVFRCAIAGNLGEAAALTRARTYPKELLELTLSCLADLLPVYAMFETQLIAARASAMDRFRITTPTAQSPVVASNFLEDFTDFVKAIRYYQTKGATGSYPRGHPPLMTDPKLMLLALRVMSATGQSLTDFENDLAQSGPMLTKLMADAQTSLDNFQKLKRERRQRITKDPDETSVGQNEHASTMFEGVGAGVQLAFAVLRLINLRDQRHSVVRAKPSESKAAFRNWSERKLPTKNDTDCEAILFVVRTAMLGDKQAGQAFREGVPVALRKQLDGFLQAGTTAGQDLFKSAKEGWPGADIRARTIVFGEVAETDLDGLQRLDVLPDYRMQLSAISAPTPGTGRSSRRRDAKNTSPRFQIIKRSRSSPVKP